MLLRAPGSDGKAGKTPGAAPTLRGAGGGALFTPLRVAAGLSAVWLVCLGAYAVGYFDLFGGPSLPRPGGALEIGLFVLAAIAPVALFAFAAALLTEARAMRDETARLSAAVDALAAASAGRPAPTSGELAAALTAAARSGLAEEREALAAGLGRLDAALEETRAMMARLENRESPAKKAGKKTAVPKPAPDGAQPALPLGDDAPAPPGGISWASVVRALNFPRDERDQQGFDAIREAVADHDFAGLLQAAEDTLTLLSEDGLYMEDLQVRAAPVSVWRRYADGARGAAVDEVGGVDDEVALAIARGKARNDPVFRDVALHFLRRFDKLVERIFAELGDDPLVLEVADSRTGRAFMVVARVMGVFDRTAQN